MIGTITGADIYAGVKMLRAAQESLFLLVEGPAEYALISTHISGDIKLVNCFGCENLDRAKELALAGGDDAVAALRDRDWIGILHPERTDPSLFLTELYDLDAQVIVRTDAARRVAEVFADPDQLNQWSRANGGRTPIEAAISAAAEVGALRLVSAKFRLGVRTERTPLSHPVCDPATGVVDHLELIAVAISRSGAGVQSHTQVRIKFESEKLVGHAAERLCCGHDLASFLASFLGGPWGGASHSRDFLLKAIRAALSTSEFKSLSFAPQICNWAASHGVDAWRA